MWAKRDPGSFIHKKAFEDRAALEPVPAFFQTRFDDTEKDGRRGEMGYGTRRAEGSEAEIRNTADYGRKSVNQSVY